MPNSPDSPPDKNCPNATTSFNSSLGKLLANDHEDEKQTVDLLFMVILTMCPLAFCAYTDPDPHYGWTEFTKDGCIVQHLSWDCLKRQFKEVLRIVLERARNLPATNTNVRSGQYFVFSTGSSRERSEDRWNESNPGWNMCHYLLIKKHCEEEEHSSKLHIELHNSDAKKTNNEEPCFHKSTGKKCLGSTSILISEVLKDEDTYHTPRIDLRESSPSDQDTVVSFHTKRFSLEDAWEESRKNIEPANAWDQPMPKSKKDCDWELLNEENIGGLKPVGFINAVKRGTQVWVYADQKTKTIAIAFRGTEKTKMEDVRTVFQIHPSTLRWESTGNCKLNSTLDQKNNRMKVHAGFLKAYEAVRVVLIEMVYSITEWSEEWTICLTGHSLGGALAALCSFHYAHLTDQAGKRPKVFMMSFGAPRVGNKAFKETYKKTVDHSYRVACGKDIICSLPLHFHPIGLELRFDKSGHVHFDKKLISNVEVDVTCIENELKEHVIRRWNAQVSHMRSMSYQTIVSERWIRAALIVQETSSRGTSACSNSFGIPPVESSQARSVSRRSISRRSLLSAQSVQLGQIHYSQGASSSQILPSIADHSENRYHHFAKTVARRVTHSVRYMQQDRYRSAEKFRSVVLSLQDRMAQQQQNSNSANQNHEETTN